MEDKTFETIIKNIHARPLREYLEARTSHCMEAQILGHLVPELDLFEVQPDDLYKIHFELFNLLYSLQDDYLSLEKYLHVHFMRTNLLDYPKQFHCRNYDEHAGSFCNTATQNQLNYCDHHQSCTKEDEISFISAKYFYLDLNNYYNYNDLLTNKIHSGTLEMLNNYDEYLEGLKLLDISPNADIKTIKKKFYQLAREFHPDNGKGAQDVFQKINNTYHILLKCRAS